MLLTHIGDAEGENHIEAAIRSVLVKGIKTRDLGGSAGTKEFGDAVLRVLEQMCRSA
jgi:isocitrate/isopropylmalate dehydrogenase